MLAYPVQLPDPLGPPRRSTFVTVLAWVFIVLSGFATLIAVLQNLMLNLMFPAEALQQMDQQQMEQMPAFARVIFGNFRLFFFGFLVLAATTLAASIGLLKRRNWARLLFVLIMALGIGWNCLGVYLQWAIFSMPQDLPQDSTFHTMSLLIRGFSAVMAAAMCGLFGWIIKRLLSQQVRAEFADPWA